MQLLSVIVFTLAVSLSTLAGSQPESAILSPDDAAAVRNLLERYRTAWLRYDADEIRSVFTQDAILMPHHGVPPVVGMAAINNFWFAPSTSQVTVDQFVQTIDEVGGDSKIAYVRGQSRVAWTIRDHGQVDRWQTHGNFLFLLRKQESGRWLVSHLIWDDVPNERIK